MNRLDFLKSAGLGAMTLPALLEAAGEPQTRTLLEWLDDIRREHSSATFVCGSDIVEYFRREFTSDHLGGHVRFTIEQYPYRYSKSGKIVGPFINAESRGQRISALNLDWINAPTEVCIAYSGNTFYWAPFNRKTFRLRPAK